MRIRRHASAVLICAAAALANGSAPAKNQNTKQQPKSVEILRDDEPLLTEPRRDAPRRGSAAKGALLPLYSTRGAAGCAQHWLQVGQEAWVCGDHVRRTARAPLAPQENRFSFHDGLPHRYYFVGSDGALGYASLRSAEYVAPDAEFQPGFALALLQTVERAPGESFGMTPQRFWVPLRDLGAVQPFLFEGKRFAAAERTEIAWVVSEAARVHSRPGGPSVAGATRVRFEKLEVFETVQHKGKRWFRIGAGEWVSDADVRARSTTEPPVEARRGERWIDVDLTNQIVTAFVGREPLFATLVSTGRGPQSGPSATPRGTSRIWVKLLSSDMDNLEDEEAGRQYAIQRVPWVMYFKEGYGLHGAFWHRSFGRVNSHGCVNLPPLDAQWLFQWARPRLPAGWTAVLPTRYDEGTLVRVR